MSERRTFSTPVEPTGTAPPEAQQAFGAALARQGAGDIDAAVKLYRRVIALHPSYGDAYNNLAILLASQGKQLASVACLKRAVALAPPSAVLLANLGNFLRQLHRFAEASEALRRALELAPEWPDALYRLGLLFDDLGESERAIECFNRAIDQRPGDVEMSWTRALVRLRAGDFARGFAEYEIRLRRKETAIGYFTMPPWQGESLTGRTILVHTEQGFGDTLQFIRLIPMLARQGARVLFSCPPELMRLMAGFPGIAQSLVHGAQMPGTVDVHVPILSLPYRLGITLETVPKAVSYLAPPIGVSGPPVPRPPGTRLAVGIAWAGNPKHLNDANRSLGLETFFGLTDLADVALYSLQTGARAGDLSALGFDAVIGDLGSGIEDFADAAAAMMKLDLVVSVDSAPAHLAGALGRPVFVLLPFKSDWRWLRGRADTPWYPTMRLFRQSTPGDWDGVIARVRAAIEAMLQGRESPRTPSLSRGSAPRG